MGCLGSEVPLGLRKGARQSLGPSPSLSVFGGARWMGRGSGRGGALFKIT